MLVTGAIFFIMTAILKIQLILMTFHSFYDNDNEFISEMYMFNNLYNELITYYGILCTNWRELHSYK